MGKVFSGPQGMVVDLVADSKRTNKNQCIICLPYRKEVLLQKNNITSIQIKTNLTYEKDFIISVGANLFDLINQRATSAELFWT